MADLKGDVPSFADANNTSERFVWKTAREKRCEQLKAVFDSSSPFSFFTSGIIMNFMLDLEFICPENVRGRPAMITYEGHTKYAQAVCVSPDDQFIFSGSGDHTAKMWNASTGEEIRTFEGHTNDIANVKCCLIHGELRLFTAGQDHTTIMWNPDTGEKLFTFQEKDEVFDACISKDSKFLLNVTLYAGVSLWDIEKGELVRHYTCDRYAVGLEGSMWGGALDSDMKHFYICWETTSGAITKWSIDSGEITMFFNGHTAAIFRITLTEDDKFIFSGSHDKTIRMWDTSNGNCVRIFDDGGGIILGVIPSRDYLYMFSICTDQTAKMWDVMSGEKVATFKGHTSRVYAIMLSKDESRLYTASRDSTLKMWYLKEKQESVKSNGGGDAAGAGTCGVYK